ncbi:MAG: tRNA (adenosine(37)-N6)-threonylcarbamoyltransferase complex transferase subunit TsaD [Deltaproteobacteria bacterium]|nr:tRNA (adenosine(37)-N6)-threonylcarbamoyltransferase complex transferase subunit TsaD [Deltaproteobacteria bacterium]
MLLGIESSCDETAAAVVNAEGHVLADVVASQIALHAPYGGVVPELAARAHLESISQVVAAALKALPRAGAELDAVAVTTGPGLVGALVTGVEFAKAFAFARDLPVVAVNHLEAHLLAVHLRRDADTSDLGYPYVGLLASGGHTALYRVDAPDRIVLLGQTRDDAAGEAYDKVAKLLGLGYPGGPAIDALAARGDPRAVELPRPMLGKKGLEFSFSGLKTAVARHVERRGAPADEQALADLCASFQRVMVDALAGRAVAACEQVGVEDLVLAGGVAANTGLRARAQELCAAACLRLHIPPIASCTDNAAMIAYTGALAFARGERADDQGLQVYSRDPARRRGRFRPDGTLIPHR